MVGFRGLVIISLGTGFLAACSDSARQPIGFTTHGEAVRANMAIQMVDPLPAKPRRRTAADANPAVTAITAYRDNKVKEPPAVSTTPSGGALE